MQEKKIKNIIDICSECIVKETEKQLEALILVGSFSRGEELLNSDGEKIFFVSDMEFLVIAKQDAYAELQNFNEQKIKNQLQEKRIDVDISIGVTTIAHLRNLKPYIFTLEVKRYGKVLWGDKNILSNIPDYSEKDINPIDAFVLLNNRIVEQLILKQKIQNNEEILRYEIDKGYVQAVNSILGVHRDYKSLYPEKKAEFLNLITKNESLNEILCDFTPRIIDALDALINYEQKIYSPQQALDEYNKLRKLLKNLYDYEKALVGKQKIMDSVKGWIKVILKKQFSCLSFSEFIGNVFVQSPQFLIYEQAVKEYFSDNPDQKKIDTVIKKWKDVIK